MIITDEQLKEWEDDGFFHRDGDQRFLLLIQLLRQFLREERQKARLAIDALDKIRSMTHPSKFLLQSDDSRLVFEVADRALAGVP